jgi:hypothetical protein
MRIDAIAAIVEQIPGTLTEKHGVYFVDFVVAERAAFLSKKKLAYSARFRIDDDKKELRFTEMLKESGSGISSGDSDVGPGFGFRNETYKTGAGARQGSIEEQLKLFGTQYTYRFEFSKVRALLEAEAATAGYTFKALPTPLGL